MSRSKAEQDGQQQDKPDRAKKLSQHGRKQQNTGLCEGDGKGTRTALGSCVLLLESVETKAQMSI